MRTYFDFSTERGKDGQLAEGWKRANPATDVLAAAVIWGGRE
jgi:hypothetical protein